MKSPIILDGPPFDWDAGERLAARHGGANTIRGAMFLDPGTMSCPGCWESLWKEGSRVRCPECGHEWIVGQPAPRRPLAIERELAHYADREPRTAEGRRYLERKLESLRWELAEAMAGDPLCTERTS